MSDLFENIVGSFTDGSVKFAQLETDLVIQMLTLVAHFEDLDKRETYREKYKEFFNQMSDARRQEIASRMQRLRT